MEFAHRVYQERDPELINTLARGCAQFLNIKYGAHIIEYSGYLLQLSNTRERLPEKIVAVTFTVLTEPEFFQLLFPDPEPEPRFLLFMSRVSAHMDNLCNARDSVEAVIREIEIDSIMS